MSTVPVMPDRPNRGDQLLSAADLADELSCSIRTVWRLLARGVLPSPSFRSGRKLVRWKRSEVEAALANFRPAPRGREGEAARA